MQDKLTAKTVGKGFAEIEEPFVLEESANTRIVFKSQMSLKGIRGCLVRQKKNADSIWEDEKSLDFRKLREGEGANIVLSSGAVKELVKAINKSIALLKEHGVKYGVHKYITVDEKAAVVDDYNKALIIKQLLEKGYSDEVWQAINELDPNLTSRFATDKIYALRNSALIEFESSIDDITKSEPYWQDFFEKNDWIFGYGLRYQFLNTVTSQPNYGGGNVKGSTGQKGDYLLSTEADIRFTVLVEIKKPNTPLVRGEKNRTGCYGLSKDLLDASSQLQVNCHTWATEGSKTEDNREILNNINTIQPKGIVVIGRLSQLDVIDKKRPFELYRQNLHNPEIVTFDELLQRAKFILHAQKGTETVEE